MDYHVKDLTLAEQGQLRMKDGAILANSGHFDVEIDKISLQKNSQVCSKDKRICG